MMWRILLGLVCIGGLACDAGPGPLAPTAGVEITASGPYGEARQTLIQTEPDPLPCDGQVRDFLWVTPRTVVLRHASLWVGVSDPGPARADTWATLLVPPRFILLDLGLDASSADTHRTSDRSFETPVRVPGGTPVTLKHQCTPARPEPLTGTASAWIDWTAP